jgi:raffinose synthase
VYSLDEQILSFHDIPVLQGVPEGVRLSADPLGTGVVLRLEAKEAASRHKLELGAPAGMRRWTALHRYEPYWHTACCGRNAGAVPVETQFLLWELAQGGYCVLVPLIDGGFRAALQGEGEHSLAVVVESNDPAVVTNQAAALFLAVGDKPFELLEQSAVSVNGWLKMGRLRDEKDLPDFMDTFGWCTWNAFYQQVSHDLVREGLESFQVGGVQPRFLILDDGWQQVAQQPSGETRLAGFGANEKFPGGLSATVRMAKEEFGVEIFTVWHAVLGYWGGVDGGTLASYGVRPVGRSFGEGILHHVPDHNENWWGRVVGTVPPEHLGRFYHDYHRQLRQAGVDGVKVDNQACIEAVSAGYGGRVAYMRAVREALEGSAQVHFRGNLTNCMSNAMEMLYGALNSNLTRTSTDFWPWIPASHGKHLYVNALAGAWFGEFIWPDWDMFESGHPAGAFHAAGRAVSGGPVFVSDKPGSQDFALLHKLVLPDGRTLRADIPGRPTADCLLVDPTEEDVLYKIWSLNEDAGILGAFNCRYSGKVEKGDAPITVQGEVRPSDLESLEAECFVVYTHTRREMRTLSLTESWQLTLPELGYELFTIVPIREGAAPLGLVEYMNSAGAVLTKGWVTEDVFQMLMRGSGLCLVWLDRPAVRVRHEGVVIGCSYVPETNLLAFELPGDGEVVIEVEPR